MIDLSIIIVNWNTRDALLNCLNSISEHLTKLTCEIIIVDNGSTDGSQEAVRSHYPKATLITNQANTGFAQAANQGLRAARRRYYLLLNSDVVVTSGALDEMVRIMDVTPRLGILAPQLINQDGSLQNSFDNFPDLGSSLFNKSLLRLFFPIKYPSKKQVHSTPFDVESVIGACMMIRPEIIQQVGLLDEDYFLFLEETDWCYRMRQKGWRVMIAPTAKVYHLQGKTKKHVLIPSRIEYINSLYKFFRKNRFVLVYGLIRLLQPFKIAIELFFNTLVCLLTIGLIKKIRLKCHTCFNLLLWHILGCPKKMTLSGLSKTISRESTGVPIHWLYQDIYLNKNVLPTHLAPDFTPRGQGLNYEVLKNGRLKKLFRLKPLESEGQYLMKLYRDGHPFSWLKNLVEGSRGLRELKIARKLAYNGIPTVIPSAIGYCEARNNLPKQTILISHELENCCGLDKYLLRLDGVPERIDVSGLPYNLKLRREVISAYGHLAAKIHQRGIMQDDFDPNNILIQFTPSLHNDRRGFNLYLVDFERIKIYRSLTLRQRTYNLASLNRVRKDISRADRIRFLRGYLNTDNKAIIMGWLKMISDAGIRILFEDYRWVAHLSLRENRDIGRYRVGSIQGFYRKRYPILNKSGFNIQEIEKLIPEIMISDKKEQINALPFKKMDNTEVTLSLRFFRSYNQAKYIWKNLNAFLRTYITPALPVALLKTKWQGKNGIIIFEQVKAGRVNPCFSTPKKIEERLTGLRELGI